mmetsp:Transcript_29967/g.45867  ORF Transcript_29967/g.45867 Transcript_29967/m.45867 type:complete len:180 (+) Transcript_29967:128-667(+)
MATYTLKSLRPKKMAKQQQRRGRYYYRCMYVSLVLAAFLSMYSNRKSLQKLKQIDTNTYGIPTSLLDEGNSPTGSKKVAFENGKDSSNDADADNDNDDKNRVKEKATTDDYSSSSSSSTITNIVIKPCRQAEPGHAHWSVQNWHIHNPKKLANFHKHSSQRCIYLCRKIWSNKTCKKSN